LATLAAAEQAAGADARIGEQARLRSHGSAAAPLVDSNNLFTIYSSEVVIMLSDLLFQKEEEILSAWIEGLILGEGIKKPKTELEQECRSLIQGIGQMASNGDRRGIDTLIKEKIAPQKELSEVDLAESEKILSAFKTTLMPIILEEYGQKTIHLFDAIKKIDACINSISLDLISTYQQRARKAEDEHLKKVEDLKRKIREAEITDKLTGLYNYGFFQIYLAYEVRETLRYHYPLSLIMLDIDDFNKYNEEHSYQEGDKLLVEMASLIKDCLREVDMVFRYGGEVFACVLPVTALMNGVNVAERIRFMVKEHPFVSQPPGKISISAGVAGYEPSTKEEPFTEKLKQLIKGKKKDEVGQLYLEIQTSLIEGAERALYQAKQEGKDRVKC
ncbi:MAG: GGDEF domain-containing protein, partial [bacterium]